MTTFHLHSQPTGTIYNVEPTSGSSGGPKKQFPFQKPVGLPFDLSFSAMGSAKNPISTNRVWGRKLWRLKKLAELMEPIDEEIRRRMSEEVRVAVGSPQDLLSLGF